MYLVNQISEGFLVMEAKKLGSKKMISHLDSCLVLIEGEDRSISVIGHVHTSIPDHQQVVVSPTSKIFAVRRPLQSTHFLCVSSKSGYMMVCHTDIIMVNGTTSTPTGNKTRKKYVTHQTYSTVDFTHQTALLS